jgi:hypothetical protein
MKKIVLFLFDYSDPETGVLQLNKCGIIVPFNCDAEECISQIPENSKAYKLVEKSSLPTAPQETWVYEDIN